MKERLDLNGLLNSVPSFSHFSHLFTANSFDAAFVIVSFKVKSQGKFATSVTSTVCASTVMSATLYLDYLLFMQDVEILEICKLTSLKQFRFYIAAATDKLNPARPKIFRWYMYFMI